MSQETRTDLKTLIDNYFTANGNKNITGPQVNEVLTNIIDSGFLQLDELRTALSTSYDPATPANWNATIPTEVKAALDQAISRVATVEDSISSNPSDNIAYVSDSGVDLEAEVGNPLNPFASINSAINAVSTNGIVKVLGGTYTEDISINKSDITLDIQSVTVTGKIDISNFINNVVLTCYNSVFNFTGTSPTFRQNTASQTVKIYGGTFNSFGVSSTVVCIGAKFHNSKFNQVTSSGSSSLPSLSCSTSSQFYNCTITSNGNNGVLSNCENNKFYNCNIKSFSNVGFRQLSLNTGTPDYLYNCIIEGDVNGFFSGASANRQCSLISYNTSFTGVTGEGFKIFDDIDILLVQGGSIKGDTDCIYLSGIDRLTGTNNILNTVRLYAGSGVIFNEASYDGTDSGVFNLQNNMINKTVTYSSKIVDNGNNTVITGLQEF